jgi:hypothetical protein
MVWCAFFYSYSGSWLSFYTSPDPDQNIADGIRIFTTIAIYALMILYGPPACNGSAHIKNQYVQGHINHKCIGSLMYKSPQVALTGCKGVS